MQLRYAIQLQCMMKAMADVVLPAVDPDNRLAQEQARLILGTLSLMAKQLPLQFRFDCDALGRSVALAQELLQQLGTLQDIEGAQERLAARMATATEVLARALADPQELVSAIHGLREAIGAVVGDVSARASTAQVASVQKCVLEHGKEQLLRDRSWLLAQNWEPNPESVPPIETLLGNARGVGAMT